MNIKHVTRLIALFLFVTLAIATVFAIVIKDRPQATFRNGSFVVTWKTADETGVKVFEVWRAQVIQGRLSDFKLADHGTVAPRGNNSTYEFVDREAYKVTDGLFVYKIRVIMNDGRFFDSAESERVLSSTAKRTWGSIKAMFR